MSTATSARTEREEAPKKEAILAGIGFGWMPEHMVTDELARERLRSIRFDRGDTHDFRPRLYRRRSRPVGKAGRVALAALRRERARSAAR